MLAEKLGMTVARLRREMGHGEFVYWSRYLQMVEDRREVASA